MGSSQDLQQQQWIGPAAAAYALSDGNRFANVNTSGQIVRNISDGGPCDGIAQGESSAAGDHIALITSGHAEIELGDTITPGQYASSDNVGRAVPATSGEKVLGRMIKGGAVGNTGQILFGVAAHQVA